MANSGVSHPNVVRFDVRMAHFLPPLTQSTVYSVPHAESYSACGVFQRKAGGVLEMRKPEIMLSYCA